MKDRDSVAVLYMIKRGIWFICSNLLRRRPSNPHNDRIDWRIVPAGHEMWSEVGRTIRIRFQVSTSARIGSRDVPMEGADFQTPVNRGLNFVLLRSNSSCITCKVLCIVNLTSIVQIESSVHLWTGHTAEPLWWKSYEEGCSRFFRVFYVWNVEKKIFDWLFWWFYGDHVVMGVVSISFCAWTLIFALETSIPIKRLV